MRLFWAFCAGAAFTGMGLGFAVGSGVLFGVNAGIFMADLYLILFKKTEN